MKKIGAIVITITCMCASLNAAQIEPFNPPPKLYSDVNIQEYTSRSFNRRVDKLWLLGLQKTIAAHFDGAVVLDVGFMNRPYPEFRTHSDGSSSLGHGVITFATKDDRIYIYGTDLTLMSPRLGINTQLFLKSVETAKDDKEVLDWGHDRFFREIAKSAAAGAAIFGLFQLFTTDPAISDASTVGLVVTGLGSVFTYGASKLVELTEGKHRVLNQTLNSLNALTDQSDNSEGRFYRHQIFSLAPYEVILKQVIARARKSACAQNLLSEN